MVRVRKDPPLSTDEIDREGEEFLFDGGRPSLKERADSGLAVIALTLLSAILSIGKWTGIPTRMGVRGEGESELSLWPVSVVSPDTVERLVQRDLGESMLSSS